MAGGEQPAALPPDGGASGHGGRPAAAGAQRGSRCAAPRRAAPAAAAAASPCTSSPHGACVHLCNTRRCPAPVPLPLVRPAARRPSPAPSLVSSRNTSASPTTCTRPLCPSAANTSSNFAVSCAPHAASLACQSKRMHCTPSAALVTFQPGTCAAGAGGRAGRPPGRLPAQAARTSWGETTGGRGGRAGPGPEQGGGGAGAHLVAQRVDLLLRQQGGVRAAAAHVEAQQLLDGLRGPATRRGEGVGVCQSGAAGPCSSLGTGGAGQVLAGPGGPRPRAEAEQLAGVAAHLMMCSVFQFMTTLSPKLLAISSARTSLAPKFCGAAAAAALHLFGRRFLMLGSI
jgi:hypothetical protein